MFGGNFAPNGWALCDGQLLPISQNNALFSLVGTFYGGDGRITFGLPELRGRMPMHWGNGPGRVSRSIGQKGGTESVTLTSSTLPSHTHGVAIPAESSEGQTAAASGNYPAGGEEPDKPYAATSDTSLGAFNSAATGSSIAHENMSPFQCVTFIIALVGLYPSRS